MMGLAGDRRPNSLFIGGGITETKTGTLDFGLWIERTLRQLFKVDGGERQDMMSSPSHR